jgi:tetratricopeptide (TPR) repeat protein
VEQLINLDLAERHFAEAQTRAEKEVARAPTNTAPYLLLANVHLARTNTAAAESVLLQALDRTPESAPVNALLARVYVASRKNQEAMKQLQELVSRNTNDLASWLMIAELHTAASNYVAAGSAYDAILAVDPRHAAALNNFAWLCTEQLQQPQRAYELASRARDVNPRNPLAAASTADTLGWVLFKNGDYVRALALIQESARVLSEQPEVLFHLGMTHYMMGEESAARVALQNALQLASPDAPYRAEAAERLRILDFDAVTAGAASVKEMENLAAQSSRDPILLARLGAVAEREGAWDQAAKAYENALQLNTNLVPVMVRLARLYSTQPKNPDRAFALARRARNLEPSDPKIAHVLGSLAYASAQSASDFQWAQGLLQESARALPDDPDVLFDMALAAYAVGDVTNAVKVMEKVVALKSPPSRTEEAARFLEMNSLLSRPVEAAASAAKVAAVLQSQPNYIPALYVNGMLQEQKRDFPAARDSYERILKLRPLFTPAYRSLAQIYATHLNDAQKAYEYATKTRESYPQDSQITRLLGGLVYQRGEFPRAVQLLKESVPAFAQDAELFYTLGLAHYKLKQSSEAKEALNKAVSLSPNSPQAIEAKRILAELK